MPLPTPTYAALIAVAIAGAPEKRLVLDDVYSFVGKYRRLVPAANDNWRNSVRHNLSLRKCFVKVPRRNKAGKLLSAWWTVADEGLPKTAKEYLSHFHHMRAANPTYTAEECLDAVVATLGIDTPSSSSGSKTKKSRSRKASSSSNSNGAGGGSKRRSSTSSRSRRKPSASGGATGDSGVEGSPANATPGSSPPQSDLRSLRSSGPRRVRTFSIDSDCSEISTNSYDTMLWPFDRDGGECSDTCSMADLPQASEEDARLSLQYQLLQLDQGAHADDPFAPSPAGSTDPFAAHDVADSVFGDPSALSATAAHACSSSSPSTGPASEQHNLFHTFHQHMRHTAQRDDRPNVTSTAPVPLIGGDATSSSSGGGGGGGRTNSPQGRSYSFHEDGTDAGLSSCSSSNSLAASLNLSQPHHHGSADGMHHSRPSPSPSPSPSLGSYTFANAHQHQHHQHASTGGGDAQAASSRPSSTQPSPGKAASGRKASADRKKRGQGERRRNSQPNLILDRIRRSLSLDSRPRSQSMRQQQQQQQRQRQRLLHQQQQQQHSGQAVPTQPPHTRHQPQQLPHQLRQQQQHMQRGAQPHMQTAGLPVPQQPQARQRQREYHDHHHRQQQQAEGSGESAPYIPRVASLLLDKKPLPVLEAEDVAFINMSDVNIDNINDLLSDVPQLDSHYQGTNASPSTPSSYHAGSLHGFAPSGMSF